MWETLTERFQLNYQVIDSFQGNTGIVERSTIKPRYLFPVASSREKNGKKR